MRGALFPLVSELRINKREFRKFPTFCCQKVSICICLRYMQRQYCSQERGQRCSPCCSGLHAPASDPSDLISCLVIFTSLSHSSQLSPPSAQGKLNMRVAGHFTTLGSSLGDYFSKSSVQCQISSNILTITLYIRSPFHLIILHVYHLLIIVSWLFPLITGTLIYVWCVTFIML